MATTTHPATGAARPTVTAPAAWHGSGLATQILVLAGRALRPVFLDAGRLFFSLLQPLVMLLLFSQVFKTVADTPMFPKGVSYIDYLVPAILFTTATTVATQAGVGMTNDMTNGVLARLKSMPVRPISVLVARSVADLARGALELTVMLVLAALIFGYDPAGGVLGSAAALLLALAVGWSLGWLFLAGATWLRGSQNVQTLGILVMMLLQFASSAFVPVKALPGYIQAVAKVNPLSYGINAARDLVLGRPPGTGLVVALLVSGAVAVVGSGLAVAGFSRR